MVPRPNILALDIDDAAGGRAAAWRPAAATRGSRCFAAPSRTRVGVVVIKDLFRCAAEGRPPGARAAPPRADRSSRRSRGSATCCGRSSASRRAPGPGGGRVRPAWSGSSPPRTCSRRSWARSGTRARARGSRSCRRLADGSYIIDGTATIRDLREQVGLPARRVARLPDGRRASCCTGLGTVPQPGMTVRRGRPHVDDRRDGAARAIAKVQAEPAARLMRLFDTHAHLHFPELRGGPRPRAGARPRRGRDRHGDDRHRPRDQSAPRWRWPSAGARCTRPSASTRTTRPRPPTADFAAMERWPAGRPGGRGARRDGARLLPQPLAARASRRTCCAGSSPWRAGSASRW